MMTDREKLVELLKQPFQNGEGISLEDMAVHLLLNDVTVQQRIHKSMERKADCKSCEHSYWHDPECSACNETNGFKYYIPREVQQK